MCHELHCQLVPSLQNSALISTLLGFCNAAERYRTASMDMRKWWAQSLSQHSMHVQLCSGEPKCCAICWEGMSQRTLEDATYSDMEVRVVALSLCHFSRAIAQLQCLHSIAQQICPHVPWLDPAGECRCICQGSWLW